MYYYKVCLVSGIVRADEQNVGRVQMNTTIEEEESEVCQNHMRIAVIRRKESPQIRQLQSLPRPVEAIGATLAGIG